MARKRSTVDRRPRRSVWGRVAKWLGIAGLLGVAAGGALIVRDERQRRAYTPEEIRARLHERAAQVDTHDMTGSGLRRPPERRPEPRTGAWDHLIS